MNSLNEEKKAMELFSELLEMDTKQREKHLIQVCADNKKLLDKVKDLMAADKQAKDTDLIANISFQIAQVLKSFQENNQTPLLDETSTKKHKPIGLGLSSMEVSIDNKNSIEPNRPYLINNRYKIVKELGRGGIGIVYLALDEKNNSQQVAIKILNPLVKQTEWIKQKFEKEIEALNRIDHPGIVKLLDRGSLVEGELFFVMEFIEGTPLRSIINSNGMALEQVATIMRQLGDILTVVHDKGIYHRDLKPENIMIKQSKDNLQIKVIDFGIATVKDSLDDKTKPTQAVGTIAYMAPEQLKGKPSAPSDIYALAVIAYELVTGRRPFNIDGYVNHMDAMLKLLKLQQVGVKVKPSALRPDLPLQTDQIIIKSLAFNPQERHKTAKNLGEELETTLVYQHLTNKNPITKLRNTRGFMSIIVNMKNKYFKLVISFIVLLLLFIPFVLQYRQSISLNNSTGNNVNQVENQDGNVTINNGDPTTSAKQRAISALAQTKSELISNFISLSNTIQALESIPPNKFWDMRRVNETELAYQDRAKGEFTNYQKNVSLIAKQLNFNTVTLSTFLRDLSHEANKSEDAKFIFKQQGEVKDSFDRFENGLQHLASINYTDIERTDQAAFLHKEMLANARTALCWSAAKFCLLADKKEDIDILSDSLKNAQIEATISLGNAGYTELTKKAAYYAKEKASILEQKSNVQKSSLQREVERRITDPYLIMLRKAAGLPNTLTEAEVITLKNKQLNVSIEPEKLFELAALSYLESDGHAATLYFQRAIETKKLSPLQEEFAQISLDRLKNPDKYLGSIGVIIVKLNKGGSFEKIGLQKGDIIVSLDKQIVNEPVDIASILGKATNPLPLTFVRDGKIFIITIKPGGSVGAVLSQLIILNAIQI